MLGRINDLFKSNFEMKNAYYDDVGYYLFKLIMIAKKPGKVLCSKEIGLEIIVKGDKDITTNEIKKNDLLYENINFLQLRIGDILTFYISHAK